MEGRLPAHLEVAGLIRAVEAAGGFAAVLHKGERDAGTLLVVTLDDGLARLWERMPQADGSRPFVCTRTQEDADPRSFDEAIARRSALDPDLWVVELNVPKGERFIATAKG